MESQSNNQQIIDLRKVFYTLWGNRKLFIKVWICTFVLSCIWILPQPRYYTSEVKLAPEMSGGEMGSLSSIASSFGFALDGADRQDAIYPELYPELFKSPVFIVGLYGVKVSTKDGKVSTDYYTYMKKHQKKNPLTWPFLWVKSKIKSLFETKDTTLPGSAGSGIDPFIMSSKDFNLMQKIINTINCSVDKRNSVVSISVQDQDPLVCATMADSIKSHLQDFIIRYRTSKAAEDLVHYQHMRNSAETEYNAAMRAYSDFCDTHIRIIRQSELNESDKLKADLILKQNTLAAMEAQLQSTKVKLQENTPAFTTLKSAIVPVKPAGPKRMIFVVTMLFISTFCAAIYIFKREIIDNL